MLNANSNNSVTRSNSKSESNSHPSGDLLSWTQAVKTAQFHYDLCKLHFEEVQKGIRIEADFEKGVHLESLIKAEKELASAKEFLRKTEEREAWRK